MKIAFSSEPSDFSVVISGDVCPGDRGLKQVQAGRAAAVLAPVKDFIASADLSLVQWETTLTDHGQPIVKRGPNLNSPDETMEIFREGGFNIAMLANNHTGDFGPDAILETMEKLQKAGFKTVGAGKDLETARKPLICQVKGYSIAIFNFCENEFGGATYDKAGSSTQDPLANVRAVSEAAELYDIIIVTLHGGHEYDPFPSPRMTLLCRSFADAGADLVFNCHTHCPEATENYHGVPIIYCPGNFYFPDNSSGLWNTGYLVRCGFNHNGATELELLPYTFSDEAVTPMTGDRAKAFEGYMQKLAAPLNDPLKLQQLFEAWATVSGKSYYESAAYGNPDTSWEQHIEDPKVRFEVMQIRNLFWCEAHCDLMKCFFRLVEEQRLDQAHELYHDIEELQKGF